MMDEMGSKDNVVVLKTAFLIGAVADGVIAIEWFLISLGLVDLPVHPSFFVGSCQDFQYVLSIGGLFMMGWAFLLYWGSLQPIKRRGGSVTYGGNAIYCNTLRWNCFRIPLFNKTNRAGHSVFICIHCSTMAASNNYCPN